MAYLEEVLSEFRKGAKIRRKDWDKGKYIVCNGNFVDNDLGRVHSLTNSDIIGNVWELYQEPEPEPDWDVIIRNKCLCAFSVIGGTVERLGYLYKVDKWGDTKTFYIDKNNGFSACRPVRKDEITFYEDKKDD